MRTALFEARYYETYYFANIIKNILSDPFPYIHKLDAFYGDDAYVSFIQPFPKFSVFHQFIAFIIHDSLYEVSTDHYPCTLTGLKIDGHGPIEDNRVCGNQYPEVEPCPSQLYAFLTNCANSWPSFAPASANASGGTLSSYCWP